jgi:hypothetical protein
MINTNEWGQPFESISRFVEVQTGLHYQTPRGWEPTEAVVEPIPGGAQAVRGPHTVKFPLNLHVKGSVELRLPEGGRLRSHVLGLSYYDAATGRSVLLAEVRDCEGELLPPNIVLYADCFTDVRADVRYRYTADGLEQDVILRESLPSPAEFGLAPISTRLEVLTEFVEAPAPVRRSTLLAPAKGSNESPGEPPVDAWIDETLEFGSMTMVTGRAFRVEAAPDEAPVFPGAPVLQGPASRKEFLPVAKRWLKMERRDVLVEQVDYTALEPELARLPKAAAGKSRGKRQAAAHRCWPEVPPEPPSGKAPMKLLAAAPAGAGLVVDYQIVSAADNFWFLSGTTYYLSGALRLQGTTVIQSGAILKYAPGASLSLNGSLICPPAGTAPAVLTSAGDITIGEPLPMGSESIRCANPALAINSFPSSTVAQNLEIRQAVVGVFDHSPSYYHTFDSLAFSQCDIGVDGYYANITLQNSRFCQVTTPYRNLGGATFTLIHVTQDCQPITPPAGGDDHGNTLSSATSANLNASVAGAIEAPGDEDWFRIQVTTPVSVMLTTQGTTDTFGHFFDGSGQELARDDDAGESLNFQIQYAVSSGTYYLRVRHYSATGTGPYTLVISSQTATAADDHGNSAASATPLNPNCTLNARLENAGDEDWFRLTPTESGTLNVFTTSSIDTYGYLIDTSGSVLIQNDDANSRLDFAFAYVVQPGTYYVRVRHYSSQGTGAYTLTVQFSPLTQTTVATPTVTPESGVYHQAILAALATTTPGAQVRYTLDGSTPTAASSLYGGPVQIARTSVLKARALKPGMIDSAVIEAPFAVGPSGGLVGHWPLDETSGFLSADLSGYEHLGIAAGGITRVSDGPHRGFRFNGSDAIVAVNSSPALRLAGDLTIAFWVRKDAENADWVRLVGKGNWSLRNYGIWEEPGSGQRLLVQQLNSAWNTVVNSYSSTRLACGVWYHVAVTFSGAQVILYLNGTVDLVATRYGVPALSHDPLTFGHAGYHSGLIGALDDVRLYSRALSANEVLALAADADADGLEDVWELTHFKTLDRGPSSDTDGDGLTELQEHQLGLSPVSRDTDRDGIEDGIEATEPSGFRVTLPGSHSRLTTVSLQISGVPKVSMALALNPVSLDHVTWTAFNPNAGVTLGPADGPHDVWVGLRGITGQTFWQRHQIILDRSAPSLILFSPAVGVTFQPLLHLEGISSEPLASLTVDLQHAHGASPGLIGASDYDPISQQMTTTRFQCYDLELAPGNNDVVVRATDLAGNTSARLFTFNLELGADTTAPSFQVEWPLPNARIAGPTLTLRGRIDDATADLVVTVNAGRSYRAVIERHGLFWVESVLLDAGANTLQWIATDAAGNRATQTLTVERSDLVVTINPVDEHLLTATHLDLNGQINQPGFKVWVNGVPANLNADLSWSAPGVPVTRGGVSVFGVRAIPLQSNNGNGTAPGDGAGVGNRQNPSAPAAVDFEQVLDKPPALQLKRYHLDFQLNTEDQSVTDRFSHYTRTKSRMQWAAEAGGTGHYSNAIVQVWQDVNLYATRSEITRVRESLWDPMGAGTATETTRSVLVSDRYPEQNIDTRSLQPGLPASSPLFLSYHESCTAGRSQNGILAGTGSRFDVQRRAQSTVELLAHGKAVPGQKRLISLTGRASEILHGSQVPWMPDGALASFDVAKLPIEVLSLGNHRSSPTPGTILLAMPAGARTDVTVQAQPILQDWYEFSYDGPRVLFSPTSGFALGVDGNRDGVIRFDGSDLTSPNRPFRFWVNGDADAAEPDVFRSGPDHADAVVNGQRDLEDFARLWLDFSGCIDEVRAGTFQVALRWRVQTGNPKLQLLAAADPLGSLNYLKSETGSDGGLTQADIQGRGAVLRDPSGQLAVQPGRPFLFPAAFWANLSQANPRTCLLFEAAAEGAGRLSLVLLREGAIIVESKPVFLEFLDVKRMYARAKAMPEFLSAPYYSSSSTYEESHISFQSDADVPFSRPIDEAPQCVVFVHGWRMSYDDYLGFSETMFKRLWWQGFRGRFCAFRWATLTSYDSYNTSEFRAWKYGKALQEYLASLQRDLPGHAIHLAAHSMGNIVASSALKRGARVGTFILMQAAVPAGCFDDRFNDYAPFLAAEYDRPTPDTVQDLGYRLYLRDVPAQTARLVPYFNPDDFALVTGDIVGIFPINWEANQNKYKPDYINNAYAYRYKSVDPLGFRCSLDGPSYTRRVLDLHESLSFVSRPRSRALGSEPRSRLAFPTASDLRWYGFGGGWADHSGQYNRPIQGCWYFYSVLNSDMR